VQLAAQPVRARFTPLSPERYALQVTVSRSTYEQMCYAQSLLGHSVPSRDLEKVLERVLDLGVEALEKKKFAKGVRSRPRRSSANGRYVPVEIRRIVWPRDGGQCTFVSEKGKRCEERTRLEFDHIDPVARGGQTTADRMQLRCRAHNQYTAECTFGPGFMSERRDAARERVQGRRQAREALAQKQKQEQARVESEGTARAQAAAAAAAEVIPVLRELKFSAEEARRGAALCAGIPDAPLEERVRVALRGLAPPCVRRPAPVAT
jgi:hypothetical protein